MNADSYCREKSAPPGSNLYYATLFYTAGPKRHLHALFAFRQELAETLAQCHDPGVAQIKLHWWSEEINRLFTGQARHPVTREMQALLFPSSIGKHDLLHQVETMSALVNPAQPDSLEDMITCFCRGQGRLWRMATRPGNSADPVALQTVSAMGGLYYCLDYLQSARQLLLRGYCPFPRDSMTRHALTPDDLLRPEHSLAVTRLQRELLNTLGGSLRNYLAILMDSPSQATLFALILGRIAATSCDVLEKQPGPLYRQPGSLTPLRKLWLAWRTRGHLRRCL